MTLLLILLPTAILLISLSFGAILGKPFAARWWLLRLGLVPLVCFILAGSIMAFPTEVPANYDPEIHGNPGRLDFGAMVVWGLVAPIAYLLVALPISLAYALWNRRS